MERDCDLRTGCTEWKRFSSARIAAMLGWKPPASRPPPGMTEASFHCEVAGRIERGSACWLFIKGPTLPPSDGWIPKLWFGCGV